MKKFQLKQAMGTFFLGVQFLEIHNSYCAINLLILLGIHFINNASTVVIEYVSEADFTELRTGQKKPMPKCLTALNL